MPIARTSSWPVLLLFAINPTGLADQGEPEAIAAVRPIVKLLDPGEEPRRLLRLNLVPGIADFSRHEESVSSSTSVNGVERQLPIGPEFSIVRRFETKFEGGTNWYGIEFEVVDAESQSRVGSTFHPARTIDEWLDALRGSKGAIAVSKRGELIESRVVPGAGTPASLETSIVHLHQRQMDVLCTLLPEEPIGLGGAWSIEQSLQTGGILNRTVRTYRVESMDGNRVVLALSTVKVTEGDELSPGTRPLQSSRNESARIELDLTRFPATAIDREASEEAEWESTSGGQIVVTKNTSSLQLRVRDVGADRDWTTPTRGVDERTIAPSNPATKVEGAGAIDDSSRIDTVPLYHASAWPEADRLFRCKLRWIGGDGAYTIDLGSERTLWLFADSVVDPEASGRAQVPPRT